MPKIWPGIKQLSEDFASLTSTNGLPHIILSKRIWMKIFWFIITVSMACGFFYQLIFQLIRTYLSYPVNVDTKIDYGKRVFPAVTFCMLNPWKTTNISGTPLDDLVSSYLDDDYPSSKYGFTVPSTTIRTQRAAKWTQLMYDELKNIDETNNQILSYGYDELFIKCVFNTKDCDESDFKEFYDPFFGRCYTFNYDGKYTSSKASPNYGLRTIFRVNLDDFLPWSTSTGVSVYIHSQDKAPFFESKSQYVPVGTASSLGVREITREKLPKPYSNCLVKNVAQKSYYGDTYEVEACLRSCIQDKIIAECNCYDPSYAYSSNGPAISCYNMADRNKALDCIWNITNTDGTAGFDVNKECKCPQNCKEKVFKITMSNALWPAHKYKPKECILDAYAPENSTIKPKFDAWNQPKKCISRRNKTSNCLLTTTKAIMPTTLPVYTTTHFLLENLMNLTSNLTSNLTYGSPSSPNGGSSIIGNPSNVSATQSTSTTTITTTKTPLTTPAPKNLRPCVNWYEDNTLLVEVYYERIDFITNMETPAYPFLSLISDIGGQIGFWLGMSIISIVEIIVVLLLMCCYFIAPHRVKPDLRSFGLKNKKQQPESLQQPVQKTNQVNPAEIYSPMKNCSSPAPLPRTPEPYLFPFHYRDNRFDFDADKIYADAVKRKLTPSKML